MGESISQKCPLNIQQTSIRQVRHSENNCGGGVPTASGLGRYLDNQLELYMQGKRCCCMRKMYHNERDLCLGTNNVLEMAHCVLGSALINTYICALILQFIKLFTHQSITNYRSSQVYRINILVTFIKECKGFFLQNDSISKNHTESAKTVHLRGMSLISPLISDRNLKYTVEDS